MGGPNSLIQMLWKKEKKSPAPTKNLTILQLSNQYPTFHTNYTNSAPAWW